jgi:multiple sugar transport system permease protein
MKATEKQPNRIARILIGLTLLLPALVACLVSVAIPTVGTVISSFMEKNLIEASRPVGVENYTHLFQDEALADSFSYTLYSLVMRLLLVLIVPLLLAWSVSVLGRAVRLVFRILYSVPVILYAPLVFAITWVFMLNTLRGTGLIDPGVLSRPELARVFLLEIDGLYTFGLACGLGMIFYLAALRLPEPGLKRLVTLKPLLVTWGVGLLATIALSFQSFTLNFAMTRGGPRDSTMNLMLYLYKVAFQYFQFGYASAIVTLLLLVLTFLGVAAVALIVLTNLKLTLTERGN